MVEKDGVSRKTDIIYDKEKSVIYVFSIVIRYHMFFLNQFTVFLIALVSGVEQSPKYLTNLL